MKKTVPTLLLIFIATIMNAQTISLGAAINKAGRQRALSQRMAKDYLLIGAGVRTEDALKDLDETASTFNENMHDLVVFAKTQDVKDALTVVADMWAKYRVDVTSNPELDKANLIMVQANKMVTACNTVVEKIQVANANAKGIKLPNTCGRQRLLLQRIATLYIAKYWEVKYYDLNGELDKAIAEFDANLNTLVAVPENTPEMITLLKFQQSEWAFLKKSFDPSLTDLKPGSIYSSTNLMVKDFNQLTTMYESLVSN
jgi:nitrate/nitrite-specific signal transduction histidine kinase